MNYTNLFRTMMKQSIKMLLGLLLAFVSAGVVTAQEWDEGMDAEPRARKGGFVVLKFRDIPADDKPNVEGEYQISNDDGTINLPYLSRVRVAGKTARQLEDMIRRMYVDKKIYSRPIVHVVVGDGSDSKALVQRRIIVTGYVAAKKTVPYRPGITLIQALLECGDITAHGSRRVSVSRNGVTRTYDYFSAKDRALRLRPNDEVLVHKRGPFESRPDTLLP